LSEELPAGWVWTTLEELLAVEPRAITDGPFGSNLKSAHYTEVGARVIRLQNVGDGEFRDERAYISLDHFESLKAHNVQAGDLVLASLGEQLPRVALVPELGGPAVVKADVIRARLHPGVDPKWVFYALQAPATRAFAMSKIRGVGRPRLGLGEIRILPIPLPPLAEQRRIVMALEDHLSRLDAAQRAVKINMHRTALLAKRIITESVPIPGPPHWTAAMVADAGSVDLGRQRHPDWHVGPNMRPYLRVANVFEDRIDTSDLMEMDFSDEVFERFRLSKGEILLNEGQSPEYLGRPAMYRGAPEKVAFTNSLIRFRANDNVDPEWALLVFRRHMHAGRFVREVRITTNIAHLSLGRFKSVEFPIPPLEEQRGIVEIIKERLAGIDRLMVSLTTAVKRSNHLRQALLTKAFSGILVPQDPADEPASELLARIQAERLRQPKVKRARQATAKTSVPPQSTSLVPVGIQEELPL
jgi:type I restriction enzyme, S subunit